MSEITRKELIEAAGAAFKANGKLICSDFEIDSENKELYGVLFLYAIGSKKLELSGYDLGKGFLIYSPISGNGKTVAMKVLNFFLIQDKSPLSFYIVTIKDLADEWKLYEKEEKVSGIRCFDRFEKGNWLIDDLGCKEEVFNLYGDLINIGERLIMHIYPKFETGAQKFHFTSNISLDDIIGNEEKKINSRYDSRASGRLLKMCNTFYLDAKEKRTEAKADTKIKVKDDKVHDLVSLSEIEDERIRNMFAETLKKFAVRDIVREIIPWEQQWLKSIEDGAKNLTIRERKEAAQQIREKAESGGRSIDQETVQKAIKILENV